MLDLKAWGNEHHRFLTGRENPQIKQSIRWLAHHQRLTELRCWLSRSSVIIWNISSR
jgi:pyruvate-formate lyase-activating enzyme